MEVEQSGARGRPVLVIGLACILVVVLYWFADHGPVPPAAIPMMVDYDEALAAARSEGKVVLIDFWADWCPPCRQMDREIFGQAGVMEAIESLVVVCRVDVSARPPAPAAAAVADRFEITGLPTLVIVDTSGQSLARRSGPLSAEQFLAFVRAASGGPES